MDEGIGHKEEGNFGKDGANGCFVRRPMGLVVKSQKMGSKPFGFASLIQNWSIDRHRSGRLSMKESERAT